MAKANVVNTRVVPIETVAYPYYDDFNEDKSFHRILFRPGYAVQARELTQIQTMLQNQIERFGQHIFVNGSSVIGGDVKTAFITSLNLTPTYANTTIDVTEFLNKSIKYSSGNDNVIARVIQVSTPTDTDPPSLFIKYIDGASEFSPGDTIKVDGEEIYANLVPTSNVSSNSALAFIEDSIYFYDGYFIKVPKQSIVISKYTPTPNVKVGLEVSSSIVSEQIDSSLLDPALESSNYQAPGATRYKTELILSQRSLDSTDEERFIELSRFETGVLTKNINIPVYSEIEEVFARRTYDESGNYTVRPFKLNLEESTTDSANNILAKLSEGKAYIFGYEYENIVPTSIQVPRARTKANVTNYNLNTNFGNYVVVDNLRGVFNTSGMGIVDLHCVNSANVTYTTDVLYQPTKIGTTRIRDVEFFSGDLNVGDRRFEMYFFDTNFRSFTGNASASAVTTSQINLYSSSANSTVNDAYVGATITITAGPSNGDRREIVSYNGATRVAFVDPPFSTNTLSNSTFSMTFDFGDVESFVANTTYTLGSPLNANASVSVVSKDNGLANGTTVVFETTLNSLVFKLPETYIVENSFSDVSWVYRKVYSSVSFTSGSATITAGTDEDFVGTSSSSNVASTVTDNFLVVVTNPQSSGRALGEQVRVTTSVTGSPEQATLSTGVSETFTATVYAKMNLDGATAGGQRIKTFVPANTTYFASESPTILINPVTGSNNRIYSDTGQVVITNPSRTPDQRQSLFLSDVIAVKKIYDLGGAAIPAAGASISGLTDVTSRFAFDTGQKDTHYDHANIRLIPGNAPPTGPLIVCCRYFKTTTDSGYFDVDSYPNLSTEIIEEGVNLGTGYSIIPYYGINNLRDCIDFRPVRQNASNTELNYTLGGVKIPVPATDFTSDYEYYLGRRDLIVLSENKQIERVAGIPSRNPQDPISPVRGMVLYVLDVPPYTSYPANVSVKFIENKRYTMRDIGLLEKRIENVEYYVNLNNLEKNTLDKDITDVDGLNRTKNGIFTDSFIGHAFGDTTSPDYQIATDLKGRWSGDGAAMNIFGVKGIQMEPDVVNATNVTFGADIATLSYTTEPFITQSSVSKFTPVADFLFASFEGNTLTVPDADVWKESSRNIVINEVNMTQEINLQRFVAPNVARREQRLREQGMSEIDILNNWSKGNRVPSETNMRVNQRGAKQVGVREGNILLDREQLNRLNDLLG